MGGAPALGSGVLGAGVVVGEPPTASGPRSTRPPSSGERAPHASTLAPTSRALQAV